MTKFSFIVCDSMESFGDLDGFAAVLRTLKQSGFDGVEFNLTDAVVARVDELWRLVGKIDFPIVSFLTGANYFGKGLCLSSPRAEIRQQAIDTLCGFTSVAARFNAVLVVGQMQGFFSDEPDRAVAANRIEHALRCVAQAAEANGSTVVVEPVNHLQCGFHNTLQAVMDLTGRVNSPRVKPMLDSFHINIEERSMTEPILRAGKELAHFHLCETNGGFLGSGHLDLGSIFQSLSTIGYEGYVSVKVYREPWQTAARATIDHLRSQGFITAS